MLAITDLLLKLSTSCFANANWSFSHGPRPDSCRKKGSRRTHKTPIFCAWWWDLLSWSSKASFLTLYFFARAASGKIYGGVQININPFCGPIAKCNYRQNRVSRTFYSWIFVRKDLENTNWIRRYIFFGGIFFCDTSKLFSVFYQQTDDYHQNDKTLQLLNDTLSFQLMTLLTKNRSVAKYDNLCHESPNTVETQVTSTYIVGTTENRYLHS